MKSLINALQEGRLIELPACDKDKALEYLAILIEAVPGIPPGTDIVKAVKEREATANTALGMGLACPHVRAGDDGELLCAVGWSPSGVDYNSPDGSKVHLLIMYYIPSSQKGSYLKEVSGIAKAVKDSGELVMLSTAKDLQEVRGQLLDWVELAIDKAVPDTRARMIKIEERRAKVESISAGQPQALSIIPFSIVIDTSGHALILASEQELVDKFESPQELQRIIALSSTQEFDIDKFRIRILLNSGYLKGRSLLNCVAVRTGP